ncbi:hypothetical protein HOG21_02420 [bacterium]|nr:hypothetical protein [bacterium]
MIDLFQDISLLNTEYKICAKLSNGAKFQLKSLLFLAIINSCTLQSQFLINNFFTISYISTNNLVFNSFGRSLAHF